MVGEEASDEVVAVAWYAANVRASCVKSRLLRCVVMTERTNVLSSPREAVEHVPIARGGWIPRRTSCFPCVSSSWLGGWHDDDEGRDVDELAQGVLVLLESE